ncbi:MAG: phosphoribosylglycinamide formyltransferase [Betaproteobacteria bacterium]|jgi:phosphoribosylglycinamide formyltransferase-1|nr:phosphoribosylglycinamide formyltransferase [Betaproteobacteria bacterium UKL13-2]HCG54202.1 phosphoribosylglycinamide formyltransferase [Betaproteobacteria bacterium]
MRSIVILISGRGSNMAAILAANLPLSIKAVISNNPMATGLDTARQAGIETRVINHREFASREQFDAALLAAIQSFAPDLVVLAGFMRILTPGFIEQLEGRIINIHPSLLPAFAGLNTHQQAIDARVKLHGATVHVVTAKLDHGPIIAQAAVPVLGDDTADTLAARVLAQEHVLYPTVLRAFAASNGDVLALTNVVRSQTSGVDSAQALTDARACLRVPWT